MTNNVKTLISVTRPHQLPANTLVNQKLLATLPNSVRIKIIIIITSTIAMVITANFRHP
jgi:hypothetical protein